MVEWNEKLEERKEAKAIEGATKEAWKFAKAHNMTKKGSRGVKKPRMGAKKASRWAQRSQGDN